MNARVLLIDDEPQLRKLVRIILESAGFDVREAETARSAISEAAFLKPDLLVLDLGLPDMDGVEVVRRIRDWSDVPILILSVRDDSPEKVAALEAGADDYVTKPFDGAELVARCHTLLRRRERRSEAAVFEHGGLLIDFVNREIRVRGQRVELTVTEYALLRMLAANAGRVVTHSQILRQVWGPNAGDQRQYLRVYVAALRKKLDSAAPIETVTGVGYRLSTSS